ncbi:MAG TPA: O-antigen ligase family protein [Candidatus Solibacter sp.]|jgi:putative inorganic carbon (HCO3(-)) transporter|nr:O-antigen ligase family protein [Candidatus Solibacter sp.]
MDHLPLTHSLRYSRPSGVVEALLIITAVATAAATVEEPLVAPLIVAGAVFMLAAARFKPLLLFVVFFLPVSPILQWALPIHDLGTLVRLAMFLGTFAARVIYREPLRKWLLSGKLTQAILAYCLIAVVSAVVFNKPSDAALRELMRLVSYLCFYYVIIGWVETEQEIRSIFRVLLFSTIVVTLFGFYQAVIGDYSSVYNALYPIQEDALKIGDWSGRITSFLSHYNGLAGYLNMVLPFALAIGVFSQGWLRRMGRVTFVLGSVAVLLTQSRGGLIAFATIPLVAAWFLPASPRTRFKWMARVCLALVVAGVAAGFMFERLSSVDDFTSVTRLAIWAGAAGMFLSAPWMGVGFGNFSTMLGDFVPVTAGTMLEAHNLYLELLAESGVVGLIGYAVLVVIFFRTALRHYRKPLDEIDRIVGFGAVAAMAAILMHGTVDYIFHHGPQASSLFFLILGLLAANERRRKSAEASS